MRLYPFEDPERDVAGSAADVEDRRAGTRIERIDEYRLPEPVDAETHQVVHQVVARRDAVEDPPDQGCLAVGGDGAEAEGNRRIRHLIRHLIRVVGIDRPTGDRKSTRLNSSH